MSRSSTALLALLALAGAAMAGAAEPGSPSMEDSGDRQPRHTVVPVYPEKARRDRLVGDVQVCFNVDREGRTSRVAVRTSTHRIFERPAISAVRASTFEPLPADAKSSGIKTCRTFRFRLTPVAIETLEQLR